MTSLATTQCYPGWSPLEAAHCKPSLPAAVTHVPAVPLDAPVPDLLDAGHALIRHYGLVARRQRHHGAVVHGAEPQQPLHERLRSTRRHHRWSTRVRPPHSARTSKGRRNGARHHLARVVPSCWGLCHVCRHASTGATRLGQGELLGNDVGRLAAQLGHQVLHAGPELALQRRYPYGVPQVTREVVPRSRSRRLPCLPRHGACARWCACGELGGRPPEAQSHRMRAGARGVPARP